jgi:hypothetical protein
VPSTFLVTTTLDDLSPGSLRGAIIQANLAGGAQTIAFANPGVYQLTQTSAVETSTAGDLDVTANLTFMGNGTGSTIIDGGGIDRIFDVQGPVNVAFQNLTLRNGLGNPLDDGGAINATSANLTLTDCVVMDNAVQGKGGAISTLSGSVTLTNCNFIGNKAALGGAVASAGGALTINNTTFQLNSAAASGGAIDIINGGVATTLAISGGAFNNNTATLQNGGAIRDAGTGLLTISNATLLNNVAGQGGGAVLAAGSLSIDGSNLGFNQARSGGAVFEINPNSTVTISNSNLSGNKAAAGNGGALALTAISAGFTNDLMVSNQAGASGGAIDDANMSPGNHTLTITASTLNNNAATTAGGAVAGMAAAALELDISSSTMNFNGAGTNGGAIFTDALTGTMSGSVLSGNKASKNGGGIDVTLDTTTNKTSSNLTLVNDTLGSNNAGVDGGGVYASNVAVATGTSATVTLLNDTLNGNAAVTGGSGVFVDNAAGNASKVALANTIVAGAPGGSAANFGVGPPGSILVSQGHNLSDDGSGIPFLIAPGDLNNVNPKLGPLQLNGGPTTTFALLPGSPAIDSGSDVLAPSVDQRGVPRPLDGGSGLGKHADIGAFELVVLTGSGTAVSATEGKAFSGPVANFTDPNPMDPLGSFSANILWGDGTSSPGSGSGSAGSFSVSGNHTYVEDGSFPISVTIADHPPGTATVPVTTGSLAAVAETDLKINATPVAANENQLFSGQVATVTDPDSPDPAGAFTATIQWGDGSTSSGSVGGGAGSYSVSGSHTYAEDGSFPVSVTITEHPPGLAPVSVTAGTLGLVTETDLTVKATPITAGDSQVFSGQVATVTDPGSPDAASSFTATIQWGDGTTSTGSPGGSAGNYTVSGSHTYGDEGSYATSVTVAELPPGTTPVPVTAGGMATVTEADITVHATPIAAGEAQVFGGQVATFTDPNSPDPASSFAAVINWGDGTAATSGIVAGAGGSFSVSGSHTYAKDGSYRTTVTVIENGVINAVPPPSGTGLATVANVDIVAAGSDAGGLPIVHVYNSLALPPPVPLPTVAPTLSFAAYNLGFLGGVRVAVKDLDGDGIPDIITGPGPGGGPDIRIFDAANGAKIGEFMAYDPRFLGGVYVAAGSLNGRPVIVTTPDAGGGPDVRVFEAAGHKLQEFMAYNPQFVGGIRLAVGDIYGTGGLEIITAPGPGGSPLVRVFDAGTGAMLREFMAYNPTFLGGVYVAAGDTNGDGKAEIITGPGAGGGATVEVFNGVTGALRSSFLGFDPTFSFGIRVATVNDPTDTHADIVCANGPNVSSLVIVYDGETLGAVNDFFAFGNAADNYSLNGVFVGGGR